MCKLMSIPLFFYLPIPLFESYKNAIKLPAMSWLSSSENTSISAHFRPLINVLCVVYTRAYLAVGYKFP